MVASQNKKGSTGPIEGLGTASGSSRWQRYKLPYLYILPAFLVLAVVTFYPIGYQIYLSFTNFTIKNLRTDTPIGSVCATISASSTTGCPYPISISGTS